MAFLNFSISIKSEAATSVCMKTSHSGSGFTRIRSHEPGAEYPVIRLLPLKDRGLWFEIGNPTIAKA